MPVRGEQELKDLATSQNVVRRRNLWMVEDVFVLALFRTG
jgi:hypothetical protein